VTNRIADTVWNTCAVVLMLKKSKQVIMKTMSNAYPSRMSSLYSNAKFIFLNGDSVVLKPTIPNLDFVAAKASVLAGTTLTKDDISFCKIGETPLSCHGFSTKASIKSQSQSQFMPTAWVLPNTSLANNVYFYNKAFPVPVPLEKGKQLWNIEIDKLSKLLALAFRTDSFFAGSFMQNDDFLPFKNLFLCNGIVEVFESFEVRRVCFSCAGSTFCVTQDALQKPDGYITLLNFVDESLPKPPTAVEFKYENGTPVSSYRDIQFLPPDRGPITISPMALISFQANIKLLSGKIITREIHSRPVTKLRHDLAAECGTKLPRLILHGKDRTGEFSVIHAANILDFKNAIETYLYLVCTSKQGVAGGRSRSRKSRKHKRSKSARRRSKSSRRRRPRRKHE
jgi:hypothetical protein